MKTLTLAALSAAAGAVAALAVGAGAGWLDGAPTETVFVETVRAGDGPASRGPVLRSSVRPLTGNAFDPERLYATRAAGVVTVLAVFEDHPQSGGASQGSGFVVSRDGLVLTNAHVVTNAGNEDGGSTSAAQDVFVEFSDRVRVPAEVVGWDVFVDIAVLRVEPEAHALAPVPLGDSDEVRVGEPVAAIGSPFGNRGSLAVGVVAATGRSIESLTSEYAVVDAIQTDAPINRGNSGGPLFDARGRVIGINAQIRSTSGTAEGVGFAIPINAARRSLDQLVADGRVAYAYVGVRTDDLTPEVARRLGIATSRGALVVGDVQGPARAAGLRGGARSVTVNGRDVRAGGDVIVAVNGRRVQTSDDLVRIVTRALLPGQVARFTVVRGGRRLQVPVRLDERPLRPSD